MKYEKAKAEIVLFDNSDVITTDSCGQHSQTGSCAGGCGKNEGKSY